MSSLFDMISSFIALLMSVAFLHFGAAGNDTASKSDAAPAAQSVPARAPSDDVPQPANRPAQSTAPIRKAPAQTTPGHA